MAKMTGKGALPDKQHSDFIEEQVVQSSIFIIRYLPPTLPTPKLSPIHMTTRNTKCFNKCLQHYFTLKSYQSHENHYKTKAKLITISRQYCSVYAHLPICRQLVRQHFASCGKHLPLASSDNRQTDTPHLTLLHATSHSAYWLARRSDTTTRPAECVSAVEREKLLLPQ